jgi:sugar phosphate isomerase/epimerase
MPLPHRRQFLGTAAALTASSARGSPPPGAGPRFRLGLVTYNVARDWDLPTLLQVCRDVGLAAVELRTTHKHGVEPGLGRAARAEVRKRFADAGVEVWGCGSVCEFHTPNPAELRRQVETCKAFVGQTADIGGRGVKVRPNALPKGVPVERTLDQIGRALAECGRAAADAGVEVWLEVHGPGTSHPPHVRAIMERCGHPQVGVTWNSNPTDLKDGSVAEAFRLLRPWLRSCHINDLYRDLAGTYPYRELFRLLRETGYDRVTLCEVGKAWPDAAAGAEFLRYYKALWAELARG